MTGSLSLRKVHGPLSLQRERLPAPPCLRLPAGCWRHLLAGRSGTAADLHVGAQAPAPARPAGLDQLSLSWEWDLLKSVSGVLWNHYPRAEIRLRPLWQGQVEPSTAPPQ